LEVFLSKREQRCSVLLLRLQLRLKKLVLSFSVQFARLLLLLLLFFSGPPLLSPRAVLGDHCLHFFVRHNAAKQIADGVVCATAVC
jgi:hypothetical protein